LRIGKQAFSEGARSRLAYTGESETARTGGALQAALAMRAAVLSNFVLDDFLLSIRMYFIAKKAK
jgi:hypothetical protein